MDLSIVIVTYNSGDHILATLESIPAGVGGLSHEIIVVDNASSDGTPQRVRHAFPDVAVIEAGQNRGFAAGCNAGLAQAQGRLLLLLNPDAQPHPGALRRLVDYLDHDPKAGIAAPRMVDPQGQTRLNAYPEFTVGLVLWQYLGLDRLFPNRVFGVYRRALGTGDMPFEVAWAQGSCLLLRREVFEAVGGLDEGFFLFVEEADFCQRARASGWHTMIVPQAAVTHAESSVVSQYPAIKVRAHHLSPLHYFRKRGKHAAVLTLKLGFTLELGIKGLVRLAQFLIRRDELAQRRLQAYSSTLREVWVY